MLLIPLNTSAGDGTVSGTGTFELEGGPILGGVNIAADGTNDATVEVRWDDDVGKVIFSQVTKSPMFVAAPMQATLICYFSVTGTGASAQFFQWVE